MMLAFFSLAMWSVQHITADETAETSVVSAGECEKCGTAECHCAEAAPEEEVGGEEQGSEDTVTDDDQGGEEATTDGQSKETVGDDGDASNEGSE